MSDLVEGQRGRPVTPGPREYLAISLLPLALVATFFILRGDAGPFWLWRPLDPSYFYLFESLNTLNLQWPGDQVVAHPGVPVYALGALVMRLLHPLTPSADITAMVLADPEFYLRAISTLLIFFSAGTLWIVGYFAYLTFGGMTAAAAIQMAPFLSKLILKRGFLVTPETLLIPATLLLIGITIAALREDNLERCRGYFSIAFGLSAGLGVAIKLTAVPVFVLPLFVLLKPKEIVRYGLCAAIAFLVLTIPAWGAYDAFFSLNWQVIFQATPDIGGSARIFGDAANVVKLLKRPVLNVPIVLSFIVFLIYLRGGGLRTAINNLEMRTLLGITLAQLTQVAFVAKQANSYYLNPSYMLSALSMVLALRFLADRIRIPQSLPVTAKGVGIVLLAGVMAAQLENVHRLDRNLATINDRAQHVDDATFKTCARIYTYPASGQSFALYLADRVTGFQFSNQLKPLNPDNDFWIDDWDTSEAIFRNWDGPADAVSVVADYPCLLFRGNRYGRIQAFLKQYAPEHAPARSCSTPDEEITVVGVNCQGELTN